MKKLWHSFEKCLGIYRWHPTIALRYLPVVEWIKDIDLSQCSLLEVGSGGLGIAPYFKKRLVGIDINFSPPFISNLIPVKASATNIPFNNNSFDMVISIDMLEHVIPEQRSRVIQELLRVAGRAMCIGVPVGKEAERQDRELKNIYQRKYGKIDRFLDEQIEYGLPDKEELEKVIQSEAQAQNKTVTIKSIGNINLSVRKWLMQGWMSNGLLVNIFFRKILLLFIPVLIKLNHEPVYRQIFFVEIK